MPSNAAEVAHALHSVGEQLGELTQDELIELGHAALTMILLRTKQGIDVDHNAFAPYQDQYAKQRESRGLSTRPDLAVTGHMLGSLIPTVTGVDEVTIAPTSQTEAIKLAAHENGVDSSVSVRSHVRSTYVSIKTGQRVSRKEASLDRKRKNKRVTQRAESVGAFVRNQKTPKREILDVRVQQEIDALGEMIGNGIAARVSKSK